MPRIRYRRSDLTYEDLFPETPNRPESDSESTADEVVQTGHTDLKQPSGWWSNESIIASMPDDELHKAADRYRSVLRLCMDEIARRHLQGNKVRGESRFDVKLGRRLFRACEPTGVRRSSIKTRLKKPTGLTPEQMLQALQMLTKLKEAKHAASVASVRTDTPESL